MRTRAFHAQNVCDSVSIQQISVTLPSVLDAAQRLKQQQPHCKKVVTGSG